VNVATNQKDVMLLGGNLPESFSHYLFLGHHQDGGETGTEDELSDNTNTVAPEEKIEKTKDIPQRQATTK
jgi:hypothetical protein